MDRIKAPVLIFHGSETATVPFAQSWTYFRTLQWAWKSAGEICNFPGEAARPTETNASTAKASMKKSPGSTNIFSRPKSLSTKR